MEILCKVGHKYPIGHELHEKSLRDGHIICIRPDGYYSGKRTKIGNCVIQVPGDYFKLTKTTALCAREIKKQSYYDLKKFWSVTDAADQYVWEKLDADAVRFETARAKNFFLDYKYLLDVGLITPSQFDSIYNKDKAHLPIYIDRDFSQLVKNEISDTRIISPYSSNLGSVSSGTYSIGSGLDYTDVSDFFAGIAATLTGNLTGEINAETITETATITYDMKMDGNTFTLKPQTGDGHSGVWNAAKAVLALDDSDYFLVNIGSTSGYFIIQDLQIDCGNGCIACSVSDVRTSTSRGTIIRRNIIKDSSGTAYWAILIDDFYAKNLIIYNNIIYDFQQSWAAAITIDGPSLGINEVYNNTVINCPGGITQYGVAIGGTLTVKNNLVQACVPDYNDAGGGGFGTTSKNLSEDATSPDGAYQSKDVHTNSVFINYAGDNFQLDSGGDTTNLAIVDDGDDLSGIFSDDIAGQARSTWYIGASEIVAAGGEEISFTTTIDLVSSTPAINLDLVKLISTSITGTTSTTEILLDIQKLFSANINLITQTPEVGLEIQKLMVATINGVSLTSDIDIEIIKLLSSTVSCITQTPDINLDIEKFLTSSIDGNTSTSTPNLELLKLLTSSIDLETLTSQITLTIAGQVEFTTAIAGLTSTSNINLDLLKELSSSIDIGTTTSEITLDITNIILMSTAINGVTATRNILIEIVRDLSTQIGAQVETSEILLNVVRRLSSQIDITTTLPSITLTVTLPGLGKVIGTSLISSSSSRGITSGSDQETLISSSSSRGITSGSDQETIN